MWRVRVWKTISILLLVVVLLVGTAPIIQATPPYAIESTAICTDLADTNTDGVSDCANPQNVVSLNADSVYSVIHLSDITSETTVTWRWYTPSGTLYGSLSETKSPSGDRTVAAVSSIQLDKAGEWTLRVSINGNLIYSKNVLVAQKPTAAYNYSPKVPSVNGTVSFDASPSSSPTGLINTYKWDFNGDGIIDARGKHVQHMFTDGGVHEDVTLVVTAGTGLSARTTKNIRINRPPVVGFVIESRPHLVGSSINLDASLTYSPEEDDLTYRWQLDDDSNVDATGEQVSWTYEKVGTHSITLTVVDEWGANSTMTQTISVGQDSDDDGLLDRVEQSGPTDLNVADTDGDNLSDGREFEVGSNPTVADTDNDGLEDARELEVGSDPTVADTDNDGLEDARELKFGSNPTAADTDSDGLEDARELEIGSDPTVADTDSDGLDDARELEVRSNPTVADTDSDGLEDVRELEIGSDPTIADTDDDGLEDARELKVGSNPTVADTDSDGLEDARELEIGSNPTIADTDDDGLEDARELKVGSNPTVADTDGDGLDDASELAIGANPLVPDSDGDFLSDGIDPMPTSFEVPWILIPQILAIGTYIVLFTEYGPSQW